MDFLVYLKLDNSSDSVKMNCRLCQIFLFAAILKPINTFFIETLSSSGSV